MHGERIVSYVEGLVGVKAFGMRTIGGKVGKVDYIAASNPNTTIGRFIS